MVEALGTSEANLRQAYADADHEQRIRLSRIGCVLALVLVPLFWGLDCVVYPKHVIGFGLARLACCISITIIWGLLWTSVGRRWISFLGVAWALSPGMAISWMIYSAEGASSPYYAGLNLVMIIVSLLMPWTAIEVVAVCSMTIAMYMVACVVQARGGSMNWQILLNNLYFMGSTAAICVTAGVLSGRRRWLDFRLRHELAQRNHQLAEMDRLKSEFYGNVSHELRTPLTLILAPLDRLLAKARADHEQLSALGMIRGNALRLLRLINDILDIVRMDGGHLVLKRSRLDLATWVPGIVTSVGHLAEAKHLDLHLDPAAVAVAIEADPMMMEKVLLNLISNAVKFTPAGGKIVVSWGCRDDGAWIAVTDTGIGIPEDELPRLFSRFHQVDSSSTRRYRGLGLGLSLSRDLVERHAGRLTAASILGKGSTFTIELPLASRPDAAAPVEKATETEQDDVIVKAYREADRSGMVLDAADDHLQLGTVIEPERATALSDLILVADDEPDMRRFLVSILRERYRVVAVADGNQAVEVAGRLRPALAVIDMMMPNLNGIQTCRALRSDDRTCECRIVLLTARGDDETKLRTLQGGADDFMTKPFNSEELLSRVHNLLENSALQRSLRDRNHELEEAMGRLRLAEAQLVQSEKMNALGSLAAGLLHEINNPLNYAHAAIQMARENAHSYDATLADMLKDANDGMERINSVISSLRTFAYPETSDLSQPFQVVEAIDLALRFTSLQCSGLTLRRQIEPDLIACGSVNQMSMVLVNLVANASKAIRAAGEGRIGVITVSAMQSEGLARIEVVDTGVGMDDERARRVFEPFYTTSEPGQGMGLGLAICHTIVRNHRGRIGITSRPGVGTTVWIELPIPAAVAATEPAYG